MLQNKCLKSKNPSQENYLNFLYEELKCLVSQINHLSQLSEVFTIF